MERRERLTVLYYLLSELTHHTSAMARLKRRMTVRQSHVAKGPLPRLRRTLPGGEGPVEQLPFLLTRVLPLRVPPLWGGSDEAGGEVPWPQEIALRLTGLVLLLSFFLLAPTARAEILIGVAGPLSGQFGVLGNQMKIGVDAAVKAINANGGINGEPLGVLAIDDACDTRRAVEAAKEFIAKDVRGVIGHYCSGTSLAAALVYKERNIPMITPTATAPQLTSGLHWNVFRLAAKDDALAALAVGRITAFASLQTPAYIGDGQAASEALQVATKTRLPDIATFTFKSGAANIAKLRQDLNKLQPNAIILGIPGAEAARLMLILIDIGFTGRVYGGEGLLSDDFTSRAGVLNYEVLAVVPADPIQHQLAAPVIAELTLTGLEADGAALPAYAATQMFAAAAKATSINDGKAMAQWLRNGQNVDTILGKISFDANGDVNNPAFTWYRWVGVSKRFLPE